MFYIFELKDNRHLKFVKEFILARTIPGVPERSTPLWPGIAGQPEQTSQNNLFYWIGGELT